MAIEAIRKVTQTEQDSQKRRDAAAAEGKQQVAQAQKEAKRLLEDARQQAEAKAREQMQQAEEKAAELSKGILTGAEQDCQSLKENARKRLDQAAELIVEKVVKG
jgi:V/A-type H+-transporting ATPase subunit G/H